MSTTKMTTTMLTTMTVTPVRICMGPIYNITYYYSLLLRTLIERKYTPVFNAYVVLLCKFVFYLRHSLCERKVNADRVESSFLFAQTGSLSIIHRKLYTIRRCCIESIGAEF